MGGTKSVQHEAVGEAGQGISQLFLPGFDVAAPYPGAMASNAAGDVESHPSGRDHAARVRVEALGAGEVEALGVVGDRPGEMELPVGAPGAFAAQGLLDLAGRAGMSGIQEWLSFYFKAPQTVPGLYPEHDIFIQHWKLKNTLRWMMGEEMITHLGVEYYD